MLAILLMGISSGLPLALTGGTLQAWMKSEGVDLKTIGLFAAVGLPYTLKFLWAPLMDRYVVFKQRRRGWMFLTQILLTLSTVGLALTDAKVSLPMIAAWSLLIAFFSASQDIVVDAWRRESLTDEELGLGSAVHVNGYLFAFRMLSGAFALILSDHISWSQVYLVMAAINGVGLISTALVDEPKVSSPPPRNFREMIVDPFLDFFKHQDAWLILLFIVLYKLGDNMASQMTIPFFLDLGFTRTEVGAITKVVGWASIAAGSLVGGLLILRLKIYPSLFLFGIFQAVATLSFSLLALIGKNLSVLTFAIGIDNFAVGMGTSAFVAYMATLTNKKFTATQYALLTSFMGVPRTILVTPTGWMAEKMGWLGFFNFCALIAIPGLILIYWLRRSGERNALT